MECLLPLLFLFNFKCWIVWVAGRRGAPIYFFLFFFYFKTVGRVILCWMIHLRHGWLNSLRGPVQNENAGALFEARNQFLFLPSPLARPIESFKGLQLPPWDALSICMGSRWEFPTKSLWKPPLSCLPESGRLQPCPVPEAAMFSLA